MKNVSVIVSGAPEGRNLHDVSIAPGTTPRDLKGSVGIPAEYLISVEGSGQFMADTENLFDAVQDGQKLRATAPAGVGLGWFSRLLNRLTPRLSACRPDVLYRRVTRRRAALVASPGRTVVAPDRSPLWQIKGWRRKGGRLVGAYRTRFGAWGGEIYLGRCPEFYICEPPRPVLQGSHAPCFRPRGNGTYYIHFSTHPSDPDSGIAAVEALITDSIRGRV